MLRSTRRVSLRTALGAALFIFLSALPLRATSVIPISDQELYRQADVVVHGIVETSDVSVDSQGRPETVSVIQPISVLKGSLTGSLVLHQLGGTLPDTRFVKIWGRPEYVPGREVVVFAIRHESGEYQTAELLLGQFEVSEDAMGRRFAVSSLEAAVRPGVTVVRPRRRALDQIEGRETGGEPADLDSESGPRDLAAFLGFLKSAARQPMLSRPSPAGALTPVEHKSQSGKRPLWGMINNQLWRWNNNATATWTLVNLSNMTGGGVAEATGALATWTTEPNSNINYIAGAGSANTIDLNAGSSGCGWSTCLAGGGVIGCGGPNGGGGNTWRGDSYFTIGGGMVQLRSMCTPNVFGSVAIQSVLTHELGHTLGLGHSDQNVSPHDTCRGDEDAATMRSSVQIRTSLGTDDVDAVRWLYGDGYTSCAPPLAPVVAAVNPNFGPLAGGTSVTVTGNYFQAGATISIGGAAATSVVVVNATTITARTPAHAAGPTDVTVTNPDAQFGTLPGSFTYNSGVSFYTVTPCRVLDTRLSAGPFGAPSLSASTTRTYTVANQCGIPSTARSISVNVTVANPTSSGYLILYPGGLPLPVVSVLNYRAGQTRANNAILPLGAAGDLVVNCGSSSGTVDFLLDVNGYFQ